MSDEIENADLLQEIEETKFGRVKRHIRENGKVYLVGAGCFVVGFALGVYLMRDNRTQVFNNVTPIIAPVFNNDNSSKASVSFGGYQHKLIECLETGQIWKSLKSAAADLGVSESMLSKHVNGHTTDTIKGKNFSIVGLGTNS